jgi:hypothetical protein
MKRECPDAQKSVLWDGIKDNGIIFAVYLEDSIIFAVKKKKKKI